MFIWNLPIGSGEGDENVKSFYHNDDDNKNNNDDEEDNEDGQRTNLTWASFGSG